MRNTAYYTADKTNSIVTLSRILSIQFAAHSLKAGWLYNLQTPE
jgi:hypothetical protein